jgi:hypothetical protein
MKKLIFATLLGLMALAGSNAFGGFFGRGCCERKCEKCPPPPCCVKTVEVKVPAKKIVECDCHWVCPAECETQGSNYVINGNY